MHDMLLFIKERFPLPVTAPMAAALVLSLQKSPAGNPTLTLIAWLTVWGALLCLRMVDDLLSIPADRLRKPERGLCCGRIRARALWWSLGLILICLAAMHRHDTAKLGIIAGWLAWYTLYFILKSRLWFLLRPFCSNLIFISLPFFLGEASDPNTTQRLILIALFIYLAVVGHEFTHSLGEHPYPENTPQRLRFTAIFGTALYAMALACGVAFAFLDGGHPGFVALLLLCAARIGYLCSLLWIHPDQLHARPFYIQGFLFFLLPLCGLIAERAFP